MRFFQKLKEIYNFCVGETQSRNDDALNYLKSEAQGLLDDEYSEKIRKDDFFEQKFISELFVGDIKDFVDEMTREGFISRTGLNRRIENQELSDLFVRMMERFADYTEGSDISEKDFQRHFGSDVWMLRTHDNQRSGGSILIARYAEKFLSKAQFSPKVNIAEELPALKLAA